MSDEIAITAPSDLLSLTADIVVAHVGNNKVAVTDLPALVATVYAALTGLNAPTEPEPAKQEPAVTVRASIKPDYLICLEDGKKLTMLKRYLRTTYNMSPEEYRRKWGLPADYPMVAPNYAEKRRTLAQAIGLGRKRAPAAEPAPEGIPEEAEAPAPEGLTEEAAAPAPEGITGEAAAPSPKAKRGRPRKVVAPAEA